MDSEDYSSASSSDSEADFVEEEPSELAGERPHAETVQNLPERHVTSEQSRAPSQTTPKHQGKPFIEFDACSDAGELILAFFGNVEHANFAPDWEFILGAHYRYFCDFAPTPNCSDEIVQYGLKLSAAGKAKFPLGRKIAISWFGPVTYLQPL